MSQQNPFIAELVKHVHSLWKNGPESFYNISADRVSPKLRCGVVDSGGVPGQFDAQKMAKAGEEIEAPVQEVAS